jgi:hypothetical protein
MRAEILAGGEQQGIGPPRAHKQLRSEGSVTYAEDLKNRVRWNGHEATATRRLSKPGSPYPRLPQPGYSNPAGHGCWHYSPQHPQSQGSRLGTIRSNGAFRFPHPLVAVRLADALLWSLLPEWATASPSIGGRIIPMLPTEAAATKGLSIVGRVGFFRGLPRLPLLGLCLRIGITVLAG